MQGVGSWPRPSCPSPPQTAERRPPLGGPLSPLHGACFAGHPLPTLESISGAPWVRGPAPRSEVTAAAFIKGPQAPPSPGLCEETPQLPLQRGGSSPPVRPPAPCSAGPGPRPGHLHADPGRGQEAPRCTQAPRGGQASTATSPDAHPRFLPCVWRRRPGEGTDVRASPPAPPGARCAPGLGGKLPAASASRLRFANAPIFHAVTSFLASRDNKILV